VRHGVGLLASCLLGAVGCATASPVLAPARVLREGRVALDVGTAWSAPVWAPALSTAQSQSAEVDTVLQSAVTHGATPPGVVSYVAGRGGMGGRAEGSIALIGRLVRIGARRELWSRGDLTLTGGLAGRFAFLGGNYGGASPQITVTDSRLYGGDLSLLFGVTRRNVYDLWVGARAGYLYNDLGLTLAPSSGRPDPRPYALTAHRLEAAINFGFRIAFGRFGAGVELEAVFAHAFGDAAWSGGTTSQSANALSLIPAGAVSYQF
jgi:hypothetical protein